MANLTNLILTGGNPNAKILVVLDPPSKGCLKEGKPITNEHLQHFAKAALQNKFEFKDFAFISASPYIPEEIYASKSKANKFLKEFRSEFLNLCAKFQPEIILSMGNLSGNQIKGGAVQITKIRGQATRYKDFKVPVFHMYNCGYTLRSPSTQTQFDADFRQFAALRDRKWVIDDLDIDQMFDLRWCTDLTDWIKDRPQGMAFDTEGTGLRWYLPEVYPFTLQLCRDDNSAIIIPISNTYYPELERDHTKLMKQCKILLEDPRIRKAAHNFKYDYHMMQKHQIVVNNWSIDTRQAVHNIDENIKDKSLDNCIRLFVPEMASYADEFNSETDKSDMINVDKDKLRRYGCGDALAVYKLAKYCKKELSKDKRQLFLFEKIQMPALRVFADTLEDNGVYIDEAKLQNLVETLTVIEDQKYSELIKYTPALVKRDHLENGEALSFTRAKFTQDILFSKAGFNLTPKVFTKTTAKDPKPVPSVSAKDHLPYFKDFVPNDSEGNPITYKEVKDGQTITKPFKYVEKLMDYSKLSKMRTTYVGFKSDKKKKGEPSGFWQYIYNGKIHPAYDLATTLTHRSASRDPNGQNIPARGEFAEMYQKIFYAPEGYTLIKADYGQAELRVVAWQANDPTMIQAYKDGKDLHAITAATSMRLSYDDFMAQPKDAIKMGRYKAKACVAEGSLVLTDKGLVAIEKLTKQMLVWDGIEFVTHNGLIDKGIRDVIEYQGLVATPDHKVLLENGKWVRFDYAKNNRQRIAQGADGEIPLRFVASGGQRNSKKERLPFCAMSVLREQSTKSSVCGQFKIWKDDRISKKAIAKSGSRNFGGALRLDKTTLRKSKISLLQKLRRTRDKKQILQTAVYSMGDKQFASRELQKIGYRQNRQRWTLRAGKLETVKQNTKLSQSQTNPVLYLQRYESGGISCLAFNETRQSENAICERNNPPLLTGRFYARRNIKAGLQNTTRRARVYDIRDCGSKNRFTVSGLIVHNCNFGNIYKISSKGFKEYSYTNYGIEITLEEAEETQDAFFGKYTRLRPWHEEMINFVHDHGYVRALHGAKRHIPDIYSPDRSKVGESERQAINSPIQRFASDLGVTSLTRMYRDLRELEDQAPPIHPCMFIHDANVFLVKDEYLQEAMPIIKHYMENIPFEKWYGIKSPVPFTIDIEYGKNLGEMTEVKNVQAIAPSWWQSDEPFYAA